MRWFKFVASLVLVAVLSASLVQPHANAIEGDVIQRVLPQTVYIFNLNDDFQPVGSGSGSIVTPTGQVLTNYHVVANAQDPSKLGNAGGFVSIWVTANQRERAVPKYLGKVVKTSPELDLALVTVVSAIDGTPVEGCLTLPTYDLGDSDRVNIGDEVAAIGFPALGGASVTYTEGKVSGFDDGPEGPWIKTDAEISPGNSGGSAINAQGELIGVPTRAPFNSGRAAKLGLLRPTNAAGPVLDGVAGRPVPGCNGGGSLGPVPDTGQYGADGVYFQGWDFPGAKEGDEAAPEGVNTLVAYFAFAGVQSNTPISYRWFLDGRPVTDEIRSERWPYGAGKGQFSLSIENAKGLPKGLYSLKVAYGDSTVQMPRGYPVGRAGAGQEPDDSVRSLSIRGTVVSADTGQPVAGALFVVLEPGVTWADFDAGDRNHVLDKVQTDANGRFQSTKSFPVNERYSIGSGTDGFAPTRADGVDLTTYTDQGGFVDLRITLKAR